MAYADITTREPADTSALTRLQYAVTWGIGAGGGIVLIEPSPYEIATLAALVLFYATGLRMRPIFLPMIFLIVAMNFGYSICSIYLMGDSKEVTMWVVTSWYMAITVILFAMMFSEDTENRLDMLRMGLIFGAVIASLAGIAGYFRLVPGGYEILTLYNRARGTFKDPNVLAAFLILPALFALQSVLLDRFRKAAISTIWLGIISLAVLLAFSRASWGQLVLCSAFMIVLMYLTSPSAIDRRRIVVLSLIAIGAAALLIVILLQFESIANLFKQRASLNQSYDGGRFGRFGRYTLGFDMALDLPLGIGPLQFTRFFPEDTHNSFLNPFMSGGWIAGIGFPVLVLITVVRGFAIAFTRTPWQRMYLAIFAAFLGTVAEAVIIDVDHWRHFWLMMGAIWGVFAATEIYVRRERFDALFAQPAN